MSGPARREQKRRAAMIRDGLVVIGDDGTEHCFPISAELYDKAGLLGWSGAELYAEAVRLAWPEATDIVVMGASPPRAN